MHILSRAFTTFLVHLEMELIGHFWSVRIHLSRVAAGDIVAYQFQFPFPFMDLLTCTPEVVTLHMHPY